MTRETALKCRIEIHAYALMPNHFHFMVTSPTATALPAAMQTLGRRYVPYFNRRHERTGGLFEGRYRSLLIEDERYWVTCMRYVELNPVRAGLVAVPEAYRWTSYRAHGRGEPDPLVTDHPVYLQLGKTQAERLRNWRAFCAHGTPEAELSDLRNAVQRGRVVGSTEPSPVPAAIQPWPSREGVAPGV